MFTASYYEYKRLLERLKWLMHEGRDDTPEGDALRDQMDEPWRHMTEPERAVIRQLSAED